eukprot:5733788-Prymnesium_polylepis.1
MSKIDKWVADYDISGPVATVTGCSELADLAEYFSSFGQKFKYDAAKCQLYLKPDILKIWLEYGKSRGYHDARLFTHGSRGYDGFAKDIIGPSIDKQNGGLQGNAFYGAFSDHIASDYHAVGTYKRGTCLLGILLTKKNPSHMAYTQYALGSRSHSATSAGQLDACAIRDPFLTLILGLVVAK